LPFKRKNGLRQRYAFAHDANDTDDGKQGLRQRYVFAPRYAFAHANDTESKRQIHK
jgi:hypothetical protein